MPARQPFTALCQSCDRRPKSGWYDLHIHTIHSDGLYTPAQVIDLARRTGLGGIAITDHDSVSGVAEAERAAKATDVEVVPGVEITAEFQGRELHLLGYFIRPDDPDLVDALERLRAQRRERFAEMLERLRHCGIELEQDDTSAAAGEALGRRHLAHMLVRARRVGSIREAFARYLGDGGRVAVPKARIPIAQAIGLVHGAGGVAAWAHPSYDGVQAHLRQLGDLGLDAVEAVYPGRRPSQVKAVRALAHALGLAVTGGSDCHGPEPLQRAVGAHGIAAADMERLRDRSRKNEGA
jgi:predicted metal-dependent phosphoesterase TrpH